MLKSDAAACFVCFLLHPGGSSYKGSVIEAFPQEVLGSGQWHWTSQVEFPHTKSYRFKQKGNIQKKTNITRMVPISSDSMVVVVVTVQDLDAAKASEEKRRKAR